MSLLVTQSTVGVETDDPVLRAPFAYPRRMDHLRYCPNGSIPQFLFAHRAAGGLNHIMAHRRKSFGGWGAATSGAMVVGAVGTQTIWRKRVRTGSGAVAIAFLVGFAPAAFGNSGTGQRIEIDVVGSGTTTLTMRPGDLSRTSTAPGLLVWRRGEVEVDADASYEIAVRKINGARPLSFLAYEKGDEVVDESVDYFCALRPGAGEPITDALRQRMVEGYSNLWKRNGSHLLHWDGTRDGTSPTNSTTTFTNVIDGSTTVSSSTPGFFLGDGNATLEEWCRLSANKTIDVVFSAHGSTTANTGLVWLSNSYGTPLASVEVTTSEGWHDQVTTLSAVDLIAKVDLLFQGPGGGQTITLNAASVYAHLA